LATLFTKFDCKDVPAFITGEWPVLAAHTMRCQLSRLLHACPAWHPQLLNPTSKATQLLLLLTCSADYVTVLGVNTSSFDVKNLLVLAGLGDGSLQGLQAAIERGFANLPKVFAWLQEVAQAGVTPLPGVTSGVRPESAQDLLTDLPSDLTKLPEFLLKLAVENDLFFNGILGVEQLPINIEQMPGLAAGLDPTAIFNALAELLKQLQLQGGDAAGLFNALRDALKGIVQLPTQLPASGNEQVGSNKFGGIEQLPINIDTSNGLQAAISNMAPKVQELLVNLVQEVFKGVVKPPTQLPINIGDRRLARRMLM